ncbi:DUF2164 domain-containing protein [Anaeroselena agilis]|uniref:DUF2164 domain-containing protein n=1 Tax=Anaeroselena agilis TaxID=3063788 RepID=A0ABU3NYY4_9FIRM|nr:DUF2164 domain-containing protein [Selenomonadales bacterium 4137-cl]
MTMKPIELSKETKQDLINSIKEFFARERDEELSDFKAAAVLDFILEAAGPPIYNQALADAHALMSDRLDDLYGLEKRPR